jgi:hypothetical protein
MRISRDPRTYVREIQFRRARAELLHRIERESSLRLVRRWENSLRELDEWEAFWRKSQAVRNRPRR